MYFVIKDKKCFDKYIKIWGKVSNIIRGRSRELKGEGKGALYRPPLLAGKDNFKFQMV